ncbi:MAG: hypothetical protein J5883_02845 [Clostridiales bacterium]|nr:hypothetical protein [Clostridiales bacterium]
MSFLKTIEDYLRSGETSSRDLGLEIEHFIIDENGDQIPFDVISPLILEIGNRLNAKIHYMDGYPVGYYTGKYSTSLEPSCQFEISIDPYNDLDTIREIYEDFRNTWAPEFSKRGYRFLTKGNLPKVETGVITPDEIPLSPKKRYRYMDNFFQTSGKYGRYMMRASASAQISVDYRSEEDMARKLRVLSKISPVLAIAMENKTDEDSTINGNEGQKHLLRIQEWDDLDPSRTGFISGSVEEGFTYKKAAEVIYNTPLILLTDEGETTEVKEKTAKDLVENGTIKEEILSEDRKIKLAEHFMSMGFFHFRVKKYIEIRVADSAEIDKALGYVALIKGLMYNDENLNLLDEELKGIKEPKTIQAAFDSIKTDGLKAKIYYGRTAEEWLEYLLEISEKALSEKDKEYLKNVRTSGDNIEGKALRQ